MLLRFCLLSALLAVQAPQAPAEALGELLTADGAFSRAGRQLDVASALASMFAADVILPTPGVGFADGKVKAVEALRANPENLTSRAEWTPARGGISADGQHGFTFGYMTVTKADGTQVPMKYLAYWIREKEGWRVAAYRRRPRAAGEPVISGLAPGLPKQLTAPSTDNAAIERFRESLASAERTFSDEAQKVGLAAAFTKYGSADAVNMGGPDTASFVFGNEAIGRSVGAGTPTNSSPVVWAPDHKVIVASSGDLGITFGFIRSTTPSDRPPVPFFTIWRRASTSDPWRYIAE